MKNSLYLIASGILGVILISLLVVSSPNKASAECHGKKCPTPTPTSAPTPTFTPTPTPIGSGSASLL